MHVLLLEDDLPLGQSLIQALQAEGIAVTWLKQADGALGRLQEPCTVDAVLLDLRLPGVDGMTWLRGARSGGMQVPVIIVSAFGSLEDRLQGLNIGADDYLVKPFAVPELVARLRAATRRAAGQSHGRWTLGALTVDEASAEVAFAGEPVLLTPREYTLLMMLARRAGKVVAKHRIAAGLEPLGEPVSPGAIEVHVHSLRRKLSSELIRTVRGIGYQLAVPPG